MEFIQDLQENEAERVQKSFYNETRRFLSPGKGYHWLDLYFIGTE